MTLKALERIHLGYIAIGLSVLGRPRSNHTTNCGYRDILPPLNELSTQLSKETFSARNPSLVASAALVQEVEQSRPQRYRRLARSAGQSVQAPRCALRPCRPAARVTTS